MEQPNEPKITGQKAHPLKRRGSCKIHGLPFVFKGNKPSLSSPLQLNKHFRRIFSDRRQPTQYLGKFRSLCPSWPR